MNTDTLEMTADMRDELRRPVPHIGPRPSVKPIKDSLDTIMATLDGFHNQNLLMDRIYGALIPVTIGIMLMESNGSFAPDEE